MTVHWWQTCVIYQIYLRSFQDTNDDGIGDLRGIERRLDYLVSLGVEAIWISPIYPSPMVDFGYDVADYCDVDSRFGTLADFDDLLVQAHRRGLKVLLDFVPNHTSDRHAWFVESRASQDNQKRSWYIWRDPAADGGPPNNWISDFGGSAWEWDKVTGQYFYHAFLKEQPDLNWRHPAVQAAMYDVMRFWFDRGVDGFRIDVLWHMLKAADFPDNPPNPAYRSGMGEMHRLLQLHSTDQPEVHKIAAEMREIADSYGAKGQGERVLIGEIYLPVDRLMHYYGGERPGVHLPFNFQLIDTPWAARQAGEFDLIHNHADFVPLAFSRLVGTPMVTTIHGFSSERILPAFKEYDDHVHYVAISQADRHPDLRYAATIHHGVPLEDFPFHPHGSEDLLFFGRIHPDKGAAEAITAAHRSGRRLIMAGIVQDQNYHNEQVVPALDGRSVIYLGPVGGATRATTLGSARALLHLINFDEPFGLSVVEALACGTPVIACNRGSMPELIDEGVTGFLVDSLDAAADAIDRIDEIDRAACRAAVSARFTVDLMADRYLRLYRSILG